MTGRIPRNTQPKSGRVEKCAHLSAITPPSPSRALRLASNGFSKLSISATSHRSNHEASRVRTVRITPADINHRVTGLVAINSLCRHTNRSSSITPMWFDPILSTNESAPFKSMHWRVPSRSISTVFKDGPLPTITGVSPIQPTAAPPVVIVAARLPRQYAAPGSCPARINLRPGHTSAKCARALPPRTRQ